MVGTKLKTVFFATILAAILVIVITLCIILIPSRACIQIDSIEHLQMVQTEDALQVTWVQPLGHGDCPMTYRIQLSNGTHLIWSGETAMPVFNFFNLSFTPCLPNTITVYAVSYLLFGNVTGSSNTFVHFGNIGPVTNLQVLQENDALVATWDPPIDSEFCSLSYEVTLQVSNVTFDTSFTFEQVDSRPCVANTIAVVPLGEINEEESLRGQEEIHAHFGEVGSVEDLQVELEGTTLLVSWSPPIDAEECQLAYQVTLSYEDVIQEYVTQVNYHNFNVPGLIPCSVSNVSVTPVATVGYEEVRGLEVNLIHIDGLGPVVSLQLTQQVNGLFASWEAPHNSEHCGTITYEVVLQTSDGLIQESQVIDGNEFVFEQANLEPCTISVVSITAVAIMNDEIPIRGYTYTDTYFADIGQVENLAVVQVEGNLLLNWMRPAATLDCPLTYEITLWHDEGVAETTTTDSLEHTFEDVDVRPCVMNEVSVIPIASKDLHESKGPETRSRHFGEIGSVTNFELVTLDQDNQLVARWDPPIESDLCELSYELLLETSEPGEPPQVFSASQLEHVFSEVEPRPCVAYAVTITPVAVLEGGPKRGLQATLAHVEDIGPVEDLEVHQSGESLLVTWAPPVGSELCQMSYELALSFGEEVLDHVQTDVEGHTFVQANLQPCTENHVSVIPTGRFQELTTQGPEISERHFAAVGPVQNLIFQEEPLGISWTEPADSDACVLSYQVQIDSGGSSLEVTGHFYPLEDIPCHHYTATVTPLVQEDQSGPPLTETHDVPPAADLGPVRYLSIFENAFVWEPPINAGVCVVWYQLVVAINGESTPFETTDRIHDGLPPCSTAFIEITAVVEGHVSAVANLEANVPLLSLGAVQNLEFLNDRVQWVEPSNSGVCPIEYRLTHTSGTEIVEERLSGTYFLIDLEICSHHVVSVYAFYEGENEIIGIPESAEISLPNDATPIGQVQGLAVTEAGLAQWLPPVDVNIDTCEVRYSIILNRTFEVLTFELDVTYFQIPNVPCSYNELSLRAVVNGYPGEEDTTTHEVGIVSLGAVQNLEFLNDRVQWVEPSNSGVCPIEYRLTHTSGTEIVEERLSETYFLIDLEICSHHVVSVYAFYEGENEIIGISESAEISLPKDATQIGQVQGLTVTEAGLALWLPPVDVNIDTCEVTYSIILNTTFEVLTYELDVTYFQIPDVACSYNELSLHAVVNGYPGEEDTTTHEVGLVSLGAVQNLEFLNDRVQWERPLSSGVCPIEYISTHQWNPEAEVREVISSETHFLIDLEICSHHQVSVLAWYQGSISGITEYAEISLPNDATPIGQVQSLTVTEAGLAHWLPPADVNINTCTVTYSIILNRSFDVLTSEQAVTNFQIPDVPCSYNELSLHAVVNGYSGEEATTTHQVGSVIQVKEAPVLVNHSITFNSVTTVWQATPMEINACQILALSVWIGIAGTDSSLPPSPVTDNKERIFISEIGNLLPNTKYQIRAAVHMGPDPGPSSDLFFFTTDSAPPENDEAGDFIKLTWDSPFVSGYEVTVHDNGPAHFLPSNCIQYNPQESVHVLTGNTIEFLLTSYLPSHNYTISVTPLGASENYVTPEARPGAPSLSHEFLAGDDEKGDVTAVVSWPIPCDVNGKLVKFSVEMQGFEEDLFAEDGREDYSVEIERLSKGSVYTVYVQTHLRAHHSDKSAITFKTPEGL